MPATRTVLIFLAIAVAAAVAARAYLAHGTGPMPEASPPASTKAADQWFSPGMAAAAPGQQRQDFVQPAHRSIYGRNGRPVDFGGKDAAQYISERAAAARTGDMRAAYEVYQAASACAAAEDPLPEFEKPAERDEFAREQQRVKRLCVNVSPVQRQERMAFLVRAADGGNRDAQVDFFMEGPNGRPADLEANAGDPAIEEWKRQAVDYLKQAGAQCDHFALALLSTAYDAGQVVPRDLKMTMAFAIASAHARSATLTQQQLRERFGEELAPADFAAAMQAGAALARTSCPALPPGATPGGA
jgi:hypothetical protein